MSLRELLYDRIGDVLDRAGSVMQGDPQNSNRGYDPDDYLLRQEIKHWAGYQNAPGQVKLRLLQAAALQKDAPKVKSEKPRRKKLRHYPPEPWGQEFMPGYLALTFTYTHVRYIS
jgi:hypothetical protein